MDNIAILKEVLTKRLSNENIDKILIKAGTKVHGDIVALAPTNTGEYASSIELGKPEHNGHIHSIRIFSKLDSGWKGVPLGCLLEWGTGLVGEQSNTFDHGYPYRQTPWVYFNEQLGHFVFTHGNVAKPHFYPGLMNNRNYFKKTVAEGVV